MPKKIEVDGATVYEDLFIDEHGVTWNIVRRAGGSMSLYGARGGSSVHHVIHDTLDDLQPNEKAHAVMHQLLDMAEGVMLFIGEVGKQRLQKKSSQ